MPNVTVRQFGSSDEKTMPCGDEDFDMGDTSLGVVIEDRVCRLIMYFRKPFEGGYGF